MKTSHLCPNHSHLVKDSEPRAMEIWCDMMRRGIRAYTQCRIDSAECYLGAATEIALLRYSCEKNRFFDEVHLTKPLEFLIELLVQAMNFDKAMVLLSSISTAIHRAPKSPSAALTECLSKHSASVGVREPKYLHEISTYRLPFHVSQSTH